MTNAPLTWNSQPLPSDDGIRPLQGVVSSLRNIDSNTVCLALDDVVSDVAKRNKSWSFDVFYTHITFPTDSVLDMALTDEQYRDIGFALMVRLVALHETTSKDPGE
jgi:hypothetical protein